MFSKQLFFPKYYSLILNIIIFFLYNIIYYTEISLKSAYYTRTYNILIQLLADCRFNF